MTPTMELNLAYVMDIVEQWEFLPGVPKTDAGAVALAKGILKICPDTEKADWLSERVLDGCDRCPTRLGLRRIYAKRFKPADGVEPGAIDQTDIMRGEES